MQMLWCGLWTVKARRSASVRGEGSGRCHSLSVGSLHCPAPTWLTLAEYRRSFGIRILGEVGCFTIFGLCWGYIGAILGLYWDYLGLY